MPARKPITNFSRGEFGPELYGRVDIPQYEAGAKRLKNFIVQRYGGVVFRPGFRFVAELPGEDRLMLVPFQYSIDASYVLALGDSEMNVAANGGMVVEEDLKIVSVTYGATTTFEIPYHDYVVGDRIELTGNTGPLGLNSRVFEVAAVPDASHVTIALNSTGYAALTASTGIVRTAPPVPPPAPPAPLPDPPAPPPPPPTGGDGGGESGIGLGGSSGGGHGYYDVASV